MNTKQTLLLVIIIFLVGLAVGHFSLPAKIEVHEVTKSIDTDKKTDDKNIIIDANKDTVVTVTKFPDGRIVTETHYVDKSVTTISDKKTDNNISKTTDDKTSVTTYNTQQYHLSLLAGKDVSNLTATTVGFSIDKKFIGPISLGVFGFTNKNVGLSIGLSF